MDRSIPVFNRLIVSQTQKRNHESHLRRLHSIQSGGRRATSAIKNPDSSFRYADYNPKKQQMEEERRTEIEKQNILLYNKMSRILNRSKIKSEFSTTNPFRQSKLRELNKINEQNKQIVKRLENQKPTISNKKLHEQHKKKEKLLKFMGTYPYKQKFSNSVFNNHSISIEGRRSMNTPTSKESRMSKFERKFQKMEESFQRANDLPAVRQTKEYASREAYEIEKNEAISLYRKNVIIEDQLYQAVISRLHHQYQFKLYDQNSYCYRLVLPQLQGNKILKDYDYDFAFISSCLRIRDSRLYLNIDKQRVAPDFPKAETPQQRVLFNESKLKNFKLQPQKIEDNPEFARQQESNLEQDEIDPCQQKGLLKHDKQF